MRVTPDLSYEYLVLFISIRARPKKKAKTLDGKSKIYYISGIYTRYIYIFLVYY